MPRICAAINCNNSGGGLSYFEFPRDKKRRRTWLINMRRSDIKITMSHEQLLQGGYVVCERHFEEHFIQRHKQRKTLTADAIPTLVNCEGRPPLDAPPLKRQRRHKALPGEMTEGDPEEGPSQRKDLQEEAEKTDLTMLQKKQDEQQRETERQLRQRIEQLEAEVSLLRGRTMKPKRKSRKVQTIQTNPNDILGPMLKHCSEKCKAFILAQVSEAGKRGAGRRFSSSVKEMGLQILHTSPKNYRYLRSVFTLPSITTLQQYLTTAVGYFSPGYLRGILSQMAIKVSSMSPQERLCTVIFDEMSIKRHFDYHARTDSIYGVSASGHAAKQAMVVMARGIMGKWKQPIGYFFSSSTMLSEEIAAMLREAVPHLQEIGLTVQAIVCDQATTNVRALHLLGATLDPQGGEESHCVEAGGLKIPIIFDVPHLLKSIRNNLHKYGLTTEGKTVLWRHIANFYEIDRQHTIRMAPKLTHRHITLPAFSKMKVSYATQVFSHSVSAGISAMVKLNRLPPQAKDTAEFIDRVNRLFDVLNSRSAKDANPWRRPLGVGSNLKETFLGSCMDWVAGWQFRCKRRPPCQHGLILSIKSILHIHQQCSAVGLRYLCTSKLNQDCIENIFSVIRGKGGHKYNPSAVEFTSALRGLSVAHILPSLGKRANCEDEEGVPLLSTPPLPAPSTATTTQDPPSPSAIPLPAAAPSEDAAAHITVEDIVEDQTIVDCVQDEGLLYVAGWLIRTLQEDTIIHSCHSCEVLLLGSPWHDHNYAAVDLHPFLEAKKFSPNANLMRPSPVFHHAVRVLELAFVANIEQLWPRCGVRQNLQKAMEEAQAFTEIFHLHPEHASLIEAISVKKFAMCRLGAEIRQRNREISIPNQRRVAEKKLSSFTA